MILEDMTNAGIEFHLGVSVDQVQTKNQQLPSPLQKMAKK